jgi:tetratricopeptide (TPR) repeat protein
LGACYDWLREPEKGGPYFEKALALDPQGHWVLFWYGWHKLQIGDLKAARKYFWDSYAFDWQENLEAKKYVDIVDRKLAEQPQTQ